MWNSYPDEMMTEATGIEYSSVDTTPYLDQKPGPETIEALKKEDLDIQKAISKAMIKASAMKSRNPVEIITEAEKMLTENNPGGLFVTVWLGVIDLETGHVDACNAGHDYPVIMKQGQYSVEKAPHGPAMAFLPGVPHVGTEFNLEPGDRIFLYTDGVVEAVNKDKERFQVTRLLDSLNSAAADASDEEMIENVKNAVDSFAGETPQFDDMTMMSFTWRK